MVISSFGVTMGGISSISNRVAAVVVIVVISVHWKNALANKKFKVSKNL